MTSPDRSPIAVFDIDGTLTDTMDVDVECYEAAIAAEIGVEIPRSWPTFPEVTDSAILATACELGGHPLPDPGVESRIARRVGALLEDTLRAAPHRFRPIPGALEIFGALREAGWLVAMATGAWRPSALVKLGGARIPTDGVPLATSSDHPTRARIIQHAVASVQSNGTGPVVYVGDGVWDGRAATSLGYGFVGVGAVPQPLEEAGARGVVADLSDPVLLLELLDRAR